MFGLFRLLARLLGSALIVLFLEAGSGQVHKVHLQGRNPDMILYAGRL